MNSAEGFAREGPDFFAGGGEMGALAPEPLDANKLVGSMSDLLRRTLGETIAIESVLAGGLWRTFADLSAAISARRR